MNAKSNASFVILHLIQLCISSNTVSQWMCGLGSSTNLRDSLLFSSRVGVLGHILDAVGSTMCFDAEVSYWHWVNLQLIAWRLSLSQFNPPMHLTFLKDIGSKYILASAEEIKWIYIFPNMKDRTSLPSILHNSTSI